MKTYLVLLLQVFVFTAFAQKAGIQFADGNWEDVLKQAKKKDKLVFMDAYTTWCGPCKMMSAQTFTDKAVGDYFNENFVSVKIDMEKGEGLELANKYNVQAYPTLLFINGDGEVVHRGLGFHDPGGFLELGQVANDPQRNMLGLEKRYQAGDREPAMLMAYAEALSATGDERAEQVAKEYLDSQEDWGTDANREFMLNFIYAPEGPFFDYLVKHRQDFEQQFGKSATIGMLQSLIMRELYSGLNEEPALEEMDALLKKTYPELAPMLMSRFKMAYYQRAGDMDNFAQAAVDYLDTYGSDNSNELNNIAWAFYETIDNPKHLKKALEWAKKSVELDQQYYNTDTLAALYFKLGMKKDAKATAEKAITLAKESGDDPSGTEELLKQIEKMK